MGVAIETVSEAADRAAVVPALAALRIAVFREWPYLYDGTDAYEADYLAEFIAEPGSVLVIARDGAQIVGGATASPMSGQKPAFREPMRARGYPAGQSFYFGESVLLPQWRGRGLGHAFFDAREAAARRAGAKYSCFCAVLRAADHPLKPARARDLHPFWRARGYSPVEGAVGSLSWKDHDQAEETEHPMQFWARVLEEDSQ